MCHRDNSPFGVFARDKTTMRLGAVWGFVAALLPPTTPRTKVKQISHFI
jgi:hypothetical protein